MKSVRRSATSEQRTGKQSNRDSKEQGRGEQGSSSGRSEDKESLEAREYRDEEGNVHHHTKTYMERHGKEQEK
jgi:hypothetical protein